MSGYGQFCPVAKAMEVLDERWTLLVVRELLYGSTHFNELRRGVPKMSPALLSKRLRTLERSGVVRRTERDGRSEYHLTECGRELSPIIDALGTWGLRWIGDLGVQDLDPHLLMWDIRRKLPVAQWPQTRTVLAIRFDDVEDRVARWWLCVNGSDVDVCDYDPGYDVSATVHTHLRSLTRIWRGDVSWDQALRCGDMRVDGPSTNRRRVPTWLGLSEAAPVPSPA